MTAIEITAIAGLLVLAYLIGYVRGHGDGYDLRAVEGGETDA